MAIGHVDQYGALVMGLLPVENVSVGPGHLSMVHRSLVIGCDDATAADMCRELSLAGLTIEVAGQVLPQRIT